MLLVPVQRSAKMCPCRENGKDAGSPHIMPEQTNILQCALSPYAPWFKGIAFTSYYTKFLNVCMSDNQLVP